MKFSYSAVWADVMSLLRTHASLIATIAGVFLFLPGLLLAYFAPQPETADFARLGELWGEYFRANWHWLLLNGLIGIIGAIAILLLIFARGISVGGAIAAALPLLIFYFLASLLSGILIGIGFILLVVPGLYLMGRLSPVTAIVVAERRRNPVDAITRCFALTKGHGWAIFGLVLIVGIAASIVIAVAAALLGILFVLVAGQDVGGTLVLIVKAAGNAAVGTLMLLLNAAIYRQLAGDSAESLAEVFE
jgi:hypothetical protein